MATNPPVRVAVTGAAGQIGYSLLFRIASGLDARPGPAGRSSSCSRSPRPSVRSRASRWSSRTARSRCSPGSCRPTTPTSRSATSTWPCSSGAMPRKDGMERSDLLERQRRDLQAAGRGAVPLGQARREGARGRQPGQHQRAHRPAERQGPRPRPLHRDDPPRPQPGHRPARRQGRRPQHRRHQDDDLGQPLGHAVPRRVPRRGRREAGLRRGRQATRPGSRATSSPPCSSGAPRSSRPAACRRLRRPPTPPSTTSAPGPSARPRATGCRWASRATAATACPRGSSAASRVTCKDGEYEIVQGLDIDDFSRARIDKRRPASSSKSATPSRSSA